MGQFSERVADIDFDRRECAFDHSERGILHVQALRLPTEPSEQACLKRRSETQARFKKLLKLETLFHFVTDPGAQ